MNETITKLLGEELSKQVTEKLGTVEIGITNDGTLVSADKHDTMKAEYKATQDKLAEVQATMKTLEGSTGTIDELKAQLKTKGEEFESFKSDTTKREANVSKKSALEKLYDGKVLKGSIDLLVNGRDLDTITIDSKGNVVDGDIILKEVQDTRKDLWIIENIDDDEPPKGKTKETIDYSKLSDQEYIEKRREEMKPK
jgi:hypothetical protein